MYSKYFKILLVCVVINLLYLSYSFARSFRVNQIPNGSVNQCLTCHSVSQPTPGNGPLNSFGQMIRSRYLSATNSSGNVLWGPALAMLDADGDGVMNGEELQDPFGAWASGHSQPGNATLVTHPGNPTNNQLTKLYIQFTNMSPHVGQQMEIRVVDKSTGIEVGREEVSAIPSPSFLVDLPVLLPDHSYWIDMYADLNQNSLYDAPPVDHAWRISLNNATGNDTIHFEHNAQFTDIHWRYELTVRFEDMAPHVGQLLELRVIEQSSLYEVARKRIEMISASDFDVELSGLELGKNYTVEMYADMNDNFLYDAPPADHAWSISFDTQEGDAQVDFEHNTNFTDIAWNYIFSLNLASMNPHAGQMFELRLIDKSGDMEVGRVRLDSILVPDFVVSIPGISPGKDYRADFYADFNRNGAYDAPPLDHAWRINFSSGGNVVENFIHNTTFTNIDWATVILSEHESGVPENFSLSQNYPNPFNPMTHIQFNISKTSQVKIELFNPVGQRVRQLVNEFMQPGIYEITWDGKNEAGQELSSGIYMYKMSTGEFVQVKRMILIK